MLGRLVKGRSSATRSTDFWLHDGSIVLVVEDTMFRVHQTILVNHSEIFQDVFSLPPPNEAEDGEDRIEGCRVIELFDSSGDFEDLLRAIYHPSHFDKLSSSADIDALLTFISGILRLSTKYFIHELRKRCTALLIARFPTSYQDYLATCPKPYSPSIIRSATSDNSTNQDDVTLSGTISLTLVPTPNSTASDTSTAIAHHIQPQPSSSQPSGSNSHHHSSHSRRHSTPHHHHRDRERERDRDKDKSKTKPKDEHLRKPKGSSIMRAIALAHETNISTILPYAYYLLARTSDPRRFLSHSGSSLSWHQKTIVLVGRSHLHAAEVSMTHAFLVAFEPSPTCLNPGACKAARGPLVEWALLGTTGRGPEPLRPWERWEKLGVCLMCVGHARRRHERGREEVWNRLPEFFELGSWSRLKSSQEL